MYKISVYFFFLFFLVIPCFSSVPALEREISLSVKNESLVQVLQKIQELSGVTFSYKSSLLSKTNPVTVLVSKKTVREILSQILPSNIRYKASGDFIILKEKTEVKNAGKMEISGYVYDKNTDKKIPNVTLYDKESLKSVTTDEYGFYSISVPVIEQCLSVNKENYRDTCLALSEMKNEGINNISLDPISDSLSQNDSISWRRELKNAALLTQRFLKKMEGYVNSINVKDTMSRDFQVSLLPFVGTNHKLSGNIYNRYSFNIIGGYSRGVRVAEIGGAFNIEKEYMHGFQSAGLFNIVGDTARGTQLAGLFNITGKASIGLQAGGALNINSGIQKGVQLAGLVNVNNKQASGVCLAGLINQQNSGFRGVQMAGLLNSVTDTLTGVSFAGLYNESRVHRSAVEFAGLFNSSKGGDAEVQIAGLFNVTGSLSGIQLAPFNFADTATGVPVGIFSFVKKGVHEIEVSSDEIIHTNIAFRTGVNSLYNVFTIGMNPGKGEVLWSVGYGLGTSFKIKDHLRSDFVLSANHLSKGDFNYNANELYKAYWGAEYRFGKRFSIAAGPEFNVYVTDPSDPKHDARIDNIVSYSFLNAVTPAGINVKGWIGGKISLRFL